MSREYYQAASRVLEKKTQKEIAKLSDKTLDRETRSSIIQPVVMNSKDFAPNGRSIKIKYTRGTSG